MLSKAKYYHCGVKLKMSNCVTLANQSTFFIGNLTLEIFLVFISHKVALIFKFAHLHPPRAGSTRDAIL